jgi:hypothetical protein
LGFDFKAGEANTLDTKCTKMKKQAIDLARTRTKVVHFIDALQHWE